MADTKQTSIENWLDGIKQIWADKQASFLYKMWRTLTNPVILVVLILIAVLVFYALKCRRECPPCKVGYQGGYADTSTKLETSI
jgi:lipopolysaccharide export LptBFGC system permease protein LptF